MIVFSARNAEWDQCRVIMSNILTASVSCTHSIHRIRNSFACENMKNPIILINLSSNHSLTKLINDDLHRRAGHCGQEFVVNELCQKYWIPYIQIAVKIFGIIFCRAIFDDHNQKCQRWDSYLLSDLVQMFVHIQIVIWSIFVHFCCCCTSFSWSESEI